MARSTAEGACALRAAGTTLRDPEIRNPDYMAEDFIAPGLKLTALVKVPLLRRLSPRILESILPGALWFELARTRHMDEVLLREVADGATQVVLPGRRPRLALLPPARRACLGGALRGRPPRHRRGEGASAWRRSSAGCPTTSTTSTSTSTPRMSASDSPLTASIPLRARSSCGRALTPYLEPEGVPRPSAGSPPAPARAARCASTTCGRRCWTATTRSTARRELRKRVEEGGEPFKFGIPRGGTQEFVEGFGLTLEEDLGPEDAHERILHHAGEPYGFGGMALVRNPRS